MMNRFNFSVQKLDLQFKKPAGTSRGILKSKPSFIIHLKDNERDAISRGECSIIPGLSRETTEQVENLLNQIENFVRQSDSLNFPEEFNIYPSVRFALETALLTLQNPKPDTLFDNEFTLGQKGIPINGLIWMEKPENMWEQMLQKVTAGFRCIKMKVGALDFSSELNLLEKFRVKFGDTIQLRLDANGAFNANDALRKLERLSKYSIHSIEQPVKASQWKLMHELCAYSPIPIALDEELIGIRTKVEKEDLLNSIQPQYIILKPSLIGGLKEADEWTLIAENSNIGWWATSALESNIGLNAIAQWTANYPIKIAQGLGTGSLYMNNIPSSLIIKEDKLWRISSN